jgi:hypothetical protein
MNPPPPPPEIVKTIPIPYSVAYHPYFFLFLFFAFCFALYMLFDGTNIFSFLFILVCIYVLFLVIEFVFQIHVFAIFKDFWTPHPKIDVVVNEKNKPPINEIPFLKQVFHIPGNTYTYDNAKSLCTAYGAKLANYKEIENAYNRGGEWCSYGWSEGQMALYPTQSSTFDKLQKKKGHEHDCGRPGINGGYIANPNIHFGVNCYGYKPRMTKEEEEFMRTSAMYPETEEDLLFQKKVEYWKSKLNDILVSPFNHNKWGEIF